MSLAQFAPNSSFIPGTTLQFALDSTSIGVAKQCPRKYELRIVRGFVPRSESVHLTFGILLHEGRELYYASRHSGMGHDNAVLEVVQTTLVKTFDIESERPWISGNANKNRETLIRTLIWYLDKWEHDPLETFITSSGRPAIEVSFALELPWKLPLSDQAYVLCGHVDRFVKLDNKVLGTDLKSTKSTLSSDFFDTFSPDNQMSTYIYATARLYDQPFTGIIIDAAQVAVSFSRFERGTTSRTEGQINEWLTGLRELTERLEKYSRDAFFPMNEKACFGCEYRKVCSKPPSVRDHWLKGDFVQRVWDPLQRRGDI